MRVLRHEHKLGELQDAVNWLRKLVEVPPNSRFPEYVKVWDAIATSSDLPSGGISEIAIQGVIDKFDPMKFRGAVHEAHELTFIHRSFLGDEAKLPRALLEKIVKGSYSELEESPTNPATAHPRNFLFELTVAARLKRGGIPVELSGDADVEFNFRNYRCFAECKRLFANSSFDANFRSATSQLKNRFRKFGLPKNRLGMRPLGLLFFSATKAANPTQSYLQTPSKEMANRIIDAEYEKMIMPSHARVLRSLHPCIAALVFYTHLQLRMHGDLASYMRWTIFPYHEPTTKIAKTGKAIFDKLRHFE